MNGQEFLTWLRDAQNRFPESFRWFLSEKSKDQQKGTNHAWHEVLSDCTLVDCMAAVKATHRGEYELPKSFDLFPQTIRRIALKFSDERMKASEPTEQPHKRRKQSISGFGAVVAEVFAARENGATQEQIQILIDTKCKPTTASETTGPRYSCAYCLDSGLRMVVAASLIHHVRNDGELSTFKKSQSEAVRCECKSGDRRDEDRCNVLRYRTGDFLPWPKKFTTDSELAAEIILFIENATRPTAAKGRAIAY